MIQYLRLDDSACVGCSCCVAACSKAYAKEDNPAKARIQILEQPGGRFHIVACDQECRRCVAECPTEALSVNPRGIVTLNAKLCVGCLACVAVCPIGAMRYYPGESKPFKCVACGICVKSCPSGAIEIAQKEDAAAPAAPVAAEVTSAATPAGAEGSRM